MGFMNTLKAWGYDVAETGRQPITMGWVTVNKGDDDKPNIRSRLVVQETKHATSLDPTDSGAVFSATPPYEAMRLILSIGMSQPLQRRHDDDLKIFLIIDIRRAHPHCERYSP